MAPIPPGSVCGHAARVSVDDRIGAGVARFWCRMMHHARLHYAVQDERALPSIREEERRAGGARPLRGRVGGAIAFAARGSCRWPTRRARGRWALRHRRARCLVVLQDLRLGVCETSVHCLVLIIVM